MNRHTTKARGRGFFFAHWQASSPWLDMLPNSEVRNGARLLSSILSKHHHTPGVLDSNRMPLRLDAQTSR
ncbi:hypothetical protein PVE_R2G0266 [Pseudomonas veronii 1YdBTEX2]|uniref:Uncharacterized protein n=1 Tax=Pseudomonas veronii 1YdBTEX2 TaxID=1295141 RepID=A0A1D3K7R4_PSEVE|nr:hypothetical protein PVE_R2G0266 [Pseudomonas veronii 1YdBTEX2]